MCQCYLNAGCSAPQPWCRCEVRPWTSPCGPACGRPNSLPANLSLARPRERHEREGRPEGVKAPLRSAAPAWRSPYGTYPCAAGRRAASLPRPLRALGQRALRCSGTPYGVGWEHYPLWFAHSFFNRALFFSVPLGTGDCWRCHRRAKLSGCRSRIPVSAAPLCLAALRCPRYWVRWRKPGGRRSRRRLPSHAWSCRDIRSS